MPIYEMLYPYSCNVVISCWKSGAYGIVICHGGTDMCFVPGSGWKHLDLEQYHISGLTGMHPQSCIALPLGVTIHHLAKVIKSNGEHARITQEHKYKRRRTKYITHHNLNIIYKSIRSQQTQHSNSRRITKMP